MAAGTETRPSWLSDFVRLSPLTTAVDPINDAKRIAVSRSQSRKTHKANPEQEWWSRRCGRCSLPLPWSAHYHSLLPVSFPPGPCSVPSSRPQIHRTWTCLALRNSLQCGHCVEGRPFFLISCRGRSLQWNESMFTKDHMLVGGMRNQKRIACDAPIQTVHVCPFPLC